MNTAEDKKQNRINRGDMTTQSELVFDDVAKADALRQQSYIQSLVEQDPLYGDSENPKIRKFETGATRDSDTDKLEYNGFNCPLVEKRYAEYMHEHRVQPDGELRASNNWKKGIPIEAYKQSLHRHFMDLWLHLEGYVEEAVDKNIESVLSAIRFNINGIMHETLKEKKKASG